jgi:hypothetical protein
LVPIMDGQPIALLCQTSDAGEIGFRFEVWHERLLQRAHAHRAPDEVVSRPPRDLKAGDDEGGRGRGSSRRPRLRVSVNWSRVSGELNVSIHKVFK